MKIIEFLYYFTNLSLESPADQTLGLEIRLISVEEAKKC